MITFSGKSKRWLIRGIGCLFLYSAGRHLLHPDEFFSALKTTHWNWNLLYFIMLLVIAAELFVGATFVGSPAAVAPKAIALFLLATFSVWLVSIAVSPAPKPCGCGLSLNLKDYRLEAVIGLARNFMLFAIIVWADPRTWFFRKNSQTNAI